MTQAQDAFGQRVGTESIGLYSESRVRGFSLQNAGNFRIDDFYFVRSGDLPDAIVKRVMIGVGVNALGAAFPAPSGLVDFQLKHPEPGDSDLVLTAGFRQHATPFVQLDGWTSDGEGRGDWSGGVMLSPNATFPDGTRGEEYEIGLVGRRNMGALRLTGAAGWKQREYNGDYSFSHRGDALPPELGGGVRLFAPAWARFKKHDLNLGAMASWDGQAGWRFAGALFHSASDRPAADFTTLELQTPSAALATVAIARDQAQWSRSAEAALSRTFDAFGASHRLLGTIRFRRSLARTTPGESVALGLVDFDRIAYPALVDPEGRAEYTVTSVDQMTYGLAYRVRVRDQFEFRLGLQASDYRKSAVFPDEIRQSRDRPWLVDALAVWSPTSRSVFYGSYVRGLEEAGVAPNSAANRNEILPTVQARQLELGLRHRLTSSLSLIAAAFDIAKPAAGFDSERRYGLIGDVRHQGVELSLSGRPLPGLSLAAGALILKPRTSGPAVESRQISARPVGVSPLSLQASTDYRIPFHPSLSIDLQLDHASAAPGNPQDTFRSPATTTVSAGARYRFEIAGRPSVVRARVQNLTDATGWTVRPSADLARQRGRTFSIQLEVPLNSGAR